jgi:ribulose-phosphate 3-epimerase
MRGVAPSILAADFARLGAAVEEVLDAGASVIHVDVMDGHFVPPITMGALVVDALKPLATEKGAALDVHLMIERPERHVADFVRAGADCVTIHYEATPHPHYTLKAIRELGALAGIALNPGTPVSTLDALHGSYDLALAMTVNPGWGGQKFIEGSEAKISALAALGDAIVEVDGGVDARTAGPCAAAGATLLVAGSAVFGKPDPAAAVRELADVIAASSPA